jgi:hypothetical protein
MNIDLYSNCSGSETLREHPCVSISLTKVPKLGEALQENPHFTSLELETSCFLTVDPNVELLLDCIETSNLQRLAAEDDEIGNEGIAPLVDRLLMAAAKSPKMKTIELMDDAWFSAEALSELLRVSNDSAVLNCLRLVNCGIVLPEDDEATGGDESWLSPVAEALRENLWRKSLCSAITDGPWYGMCCMPCRMRRKAATMG